VNYYFQPVEVVKTNLMKFEWTKTELKWIFYDQNKTNGKTVITGKRIFLKPAKNTFSELGNEIVLRAPRTAE